MKIKKEIVIPLGIGTAALITALAIGVKPDALPAANDISARVDTAYKYINELDYDRAIAEFEAILLADPMNVDAYIGLARAYEGLGDTSKAEEILREGVEKTGSDRIRTELLRISELAVDAVDEMTENTSVSVTSPTELTESSFTQELTFTTTFPDTVTTPVTTTLPVTESETESSPVTIPSVTVSGTVPVTTVTTVQTTAAQNTTVQNTTVATIAPMTTSRAATAKQTTTTTQETTAATTKKKKRKKKQSEATAIVTMETTDPVTTATTVVSEEEPTTVESIDESLEASLMRARNYVEGGDIQNALEEYEQLLSTYPECADAYLEVSEIYVNIKRYDTAVKRLLDGYDITGDERLLEAAKKINEEYDLNMIPVETVTTPYIPSHPSGPTDNNYNSGWSLWSNSGWQWWSSP